MHERGVDADLLSLVIKLLMQHPKSHLRRLFHCCCFYGSCFEALLPHGETCCDVGNPSSDELRWLRHQLLSFTARGTKTGVDMVVQKQGCPEVQIGKFDPARFSILKFKKNLTEPALRTL